MKTRSLEHQIQQAAKINRDLALPIGERTWRTWPLCMTCGREVDSVDLKEVSNKGCEIVATHHGAEDAVRVTWKVAQEANANNPLEDRYVGWQLKRALHDTNFFDPSHIER